MSTSIIVTIAVIVFLLVFAVIGFSRGFLRVVLSALAMVLTMVLTGVFAPMVADYAENSMAIGERLRQNIEEYANEKLSGMTGNTDQIQDEFLESLPITASMKAELKTKYDVASRIDDGMNAFARSIASSLTTLIIKLLSYVLLFIVILLVLRLIMRLSNLINHIPIIGGINRIFGAIVGLAEGIILLWVICMIIMIMSGTDFGVACQEVIGSSKFLTFIYEHNYLMSVVNSVTGLFTMRF